MNWIKLERPTRVDDLTDGQRRIGRVFRDSAGDWVMVGHFNGNGGGCDCCSTDGTMVVDYTDDVIALLDGETRKAHE